MEKLSEKLTNYSIYNVIEEHCSDLQELYTKEKECMHQPISRYESDFVSISSLKEISTTFRNDYIKDADDCYENDETLILRISAPAVVEKNDCGAGSNLVEEMRLHFSNGDQNMKLSDADLLNKLDKNLDKLYRSRKDCGEILKSVPSSTYTSFKEKLTKKSDLASSRGISLHDSNVKLEMKEPERKRGGGFKRKLPNPILAVGDLGDSITVPTALLDGDRVIKKFRRRRRLGVLVTSNAAIAAAKKAAANGIPITVTTAFRTPSTTQKRAPVSSSCIQAQSKAAPVAPRGVKWAVRGSSKMARGSVHPSEVLRAVMMELEAIGLEVRGAEVDKKIAQTQACLVAVEAAFSTAGNWMQEGAQHSFQGHSDMKVLTEGDSGINGDKDGVIAVEDTPAMVVESNEEQGSNSSSLIVSAAAAGVQGVDSVSHAPQQSTALSTDHADTGALSAAPLLPPLPASFIDHQASLPFSSTTTSLDTHSPAPAAALAPSSSDSKTTTNKSFVHAIAEHSEDLEVKHSVSRSASAVAGDCLVLCRDARDGHDKLSLEARKQSLEGARRRWEGSIALTLSLQTLVIPSIPSILPSSLPVTTSTSTALRPLAGHDSSPLHALVNEAHTEGGDSTTLVTVKMEKSSEDSATELKHAQHFTDPYAITAIKSETETSTSILTTLKSSNSSNSNSSGPASGVSAESLYPYPPLAMKLEDMPVPACRIVNPFSNGNRGAWDWLTAPYKPHVATPATDPTPSSSSSSSSSASSSSSSFPPSSSSSSSSSSAPASSYPPTVPAHYTQDPRSFHKQSLYNPNYENNSSSSQDLSRARCRAYADSLLQASGSGGCFDHCVKRATGLLRMDLNAIIVDECLGDDRELNTTHRAVLTGSVVVSAFADALRVHPSVPEKETAKEKEKEKEKGRVVKVEEDMDICEHGAPLHLKQPPLTSTSTGTGPGMSTRKKETNMHAPHHCNKHLINSSELWGPVLVVCKSQDIRAWEEGLGAVFRSKNGGQKSAEPYNDIKHQVDKSHMDIDGMSSSSKGVYDEVMNSSGSGQSASLSSSAGCAESRIQFVGYYGSDSDRAKIRAYITPNEGDPMGTGPGVWGGLYSERSPCHVMIANYESFLSDISDFSTILWHSVVFDSPWGLLSNTHSSKAGSYASFTNDITHLKCRHRIYSSSSLSNKHVPSNINSLCSSLSPGKSASKQSRSDGSSSQEGKVCVLPDLIACATMLFPALQNIVQFLSDGDDIAAAVADSQPASLPDQTLLPSLLESCIDPRSALQLLRLLGCVTAVCVEDWLLDGLFHPHTSPSTGDKTNAVSMGDTATAPSSSSVQEVSCVDMTDSDTAHLDATDSAIIPTSDTNAVSVPANENATSDSASAAASTAQMWGRDEILSSLPWLRWRGVALTPAGDDSSQPHVSATSDFSGQRHAEHLDDTVSQGSDDVREKEVKKIAAMCSKLSCAQTEHTTQYRDEELEREVDIALSRRIGKPGLKSTSRGGVQAARDAPCVLRRKVVPRSGPNRNHAATDRQTPKGEGPNSGVGKDHGSLQEGLAQMLAANRDALMEKRTYSMINRKPSLRNQMLARKGRHSHSPQQSDSGPGDGSVSRIRRNYNGEDSAVNGETGNGNGRSSSDSRPLLKPLRKSLFQVSGPSLEFDPNDFVTSSTAVVAGVSKKSDIRAALGPGRIRGDWISALIAGGPPPGTKKRADPGPGIPKPTSAPCTVAATSSSFKKKSSRDHNEDDFTAIEDGSELNLPTVHSSHDPPVLSAVHTKSILERKPPLAFNVSRHQDKGRMKIGGGNIPPKRNSHGPGKPIRHKESDRSAEKNTDLILAPTVKKKRPSDDVRSQHSVPQSQSSIPESGTGAGAGAGAGAVAVAGVSSRDNPLNSFTPWRSGTQDSNGGAGNGGVGNGGAGAGAGAKRVKHNPEESNLIPVSAAHGTSSGPHPSLSSIPAAGNSSKTGTRFPPTFKVQTRPPPALSQTSTQPFSMNQEMKGFEQHNRSSNNDKMDIEEPYMEGSGIPGYPRIPGDNSHPVVPHIDHEGHVDDHSDSPSAKPLSPSYTQSGRDSKCLQRRDGIPTARSMHSNSVGGVIVSGTLQRAKPGPKPRLQFTSDGDSNTVRVLLSKGPGAGAGRTVAMTQLEEKLKFVTRFGTKWQAFIDCPARLRFLGYFASEEKASLAFDVAYSQRNAHMGQGQGHSQLTTSPPQYHIANTHTNTHALHDMDIDSDSRNSFQKIKREMKDKESCLGEKVAVGAQAVSDALLLLRVHAAKEYLESLEPPSVKEGEKAAGGKLNFNSLSESLPENSTSTSTSTHDEINKDSESSSTENSNKSEAEHTRDIALLTDIIRDKLPQPPHDCNDSSGPALDLVLSVLSTDSLIKGIGAMGTPHTHSYKKESSPNVKGNTDTDCKADPFSEDISPGLLLSCWSHTISSSLAGTYDHRQSTAGVVGLLAHAMLINKSQGLATRLTSHRTILGRAPSSLLPLGDLLVGQSPTAPSSSSSPDASNFGNSTSTSTSSSTVTGLNLVRRSPQYRDEVQEGAGRVEHFVIIGTDLSIARRHVEIYWDSNEKSFFIRNISTEIQSYVPSRGSDSGESYRAGGSGSSSDADRGYQGKPKAGTRRKGGSVYLRGVEVTPGGRGMLLKSQSIVQIGSSIFTFVLPSSKSAANKQDVDTPSYQRLSLALSLKAAIEIRDLPMESATVEAQQFLLDESVRLDERAVKGGLQRLHLSSDPTSTHTDEEEREFGPQGSGTKTPSNKHSINTNFNNSSSDNYHNGHNVHNNNTENNNDNTGEDGTDLKKKRRRRATDSTALVNSPSTGSSGPHPHRGSTGSWDKGAKRSRALQALRANVYFALPHPGYEAKDKEKDKDKDLYPLQAEISKNRRQSSLAAVVKALQHYASNHPLSCTDSNAESENTEVKEKTKPKPKPKKEKENLSCIDTSLVTGALLTPSVMSNSGSSGIYYAGPMGMRINPPGPMGGLRLSHTGPVGSNSSGPMSMGPSGSMSMGASGSMSMGPSGSMGMGPSGSMSMGPSGSMSMGPSGSMRTGPSGSTGMGPSGSMGMGPSGAMGVHPSGSMGVGPSGSTGMGPSGSMGMGPSGVMSMGPSSSMGMNASGSMGMGPSGSMGVGPSGSTGMGPSGSMGMNASGSMGMGPSVSMGMHPSGSMSMGPSVSGGMYPSGSIGMGTSGPMGLGSSGSMGMGPSVSGGMYPSGSVAMGAFCPTGLSASGAMSMGSMGMSAMGMGASGPMSMGPSGPMGMSPSGPKGMGASGLMGMSTSGPISVGGSGPTDPSSSMGMGSSGSMGMNASGPMGMGASGPMRTGASGSMGMGASGSMGTSSPGPMRTGASGSMGTSPSGPMRTGASGSISSSPPGPMRTGPSGSMGTSPPGPMPTGPSGSMGMGQSGSMGTSSSGPMRTGPSRSMGTSSSGPMRTGASGSMSMGPSGSMGMGPSGSMGMVPSGSMGMGPSGSMSMCTSGSMSMGPSGITGICPSGPMGMGPSGSMGMGPSGSKGVGNTPSPSHPYLLLQSPPQSGTFAAPIPSPPLISIFSPGTPSVRGYTSIPLPSAAPDIDLKKSGERERERDSHRDKERDMERERDKDLIHTENPFNNSNESSCTTGDTDNRTTFDNKKINSNGSHSSISTNSSETSQNMDDKDGLLALEGLLSLSNY